jgi:hypothetical protein
MFRNMHATVGQSQGRVMLSARKRAGSSATPGRSAPSLSPFPLPPSALRLGLSLTEVLISMGILTVGLLGVASVFPVASFYMQKGDIADRGSAIAQAAFNEVISNGTLNPERWLMLYTTLPNNRKSSYSKPFAQGLRDELGTQAGATAITRNRQLNARYGSVYAIDPIGANSSPIDPTNSLDRRQMASSQKLPMNASPAGYWNYWQPWNPAGLAGLVNENVRWPVMRVTLAQAPVQGLGTYSPWPMEQSIAERLFSTTDELAMDMPPQADRPSIQRMDSYDLDNDSRPDPLARQSQGNYSWIVTVSPSTANARNALAYPSEGFAYEVSVAVFYKRVLDNANDDDAIRGESSTRGRIVSTGLNGGEMLIERIGTSAEPFKRLKVGNWVPVCGPLPSSTDQEPAFFFRWYRILSIENEAPGVITDQANQRLISLRGPQWPWQPAATLTTNELSNNVCLAIIPNVVAVHSKAVQLEGKSAWSMQ